MSIKVYSKKKNKKVFARQITHFVSPIFPCETLLRDPLFHYSNMHRFDHAGGRIF